MNTKVISVIGLGYIGLPTASILATKGYKVNGFDVDAKIVEKINSGESHIYEPDLDKYLSNAIQSSNLRAHTEIKPADIFIVCVPTPFYEESNPPKPNIEYIISAAKNIAKVLQPKNLIILESTSPVGTTQNFVKILKDNNVDLSSIFISYCPERVLPGNIIKEFVNNDRLIGGINKESSEVTKNFYKTFTKGKIFITDDKTAEMCKLTENSFRDVNIAFANELSIICENNGIDVNELISLSNKHPRVDILQPGPGVGGHCIAVDPWFIVDLDEKNSKLIKASRERNLYKTEWVINKIENEVKSFFNKNGKEPSILILGISFKPNIDDLRQSPAFYVANHLNEKYEISVLEPNINRHDKFKLANQDDVFKNDLIIGLVKHDEFCKSDFQNNLSEANFIDFCGITDHSL